VYTCNSVHTLCSSMIPRVLAAVALFSPLSLSVRPDVAYHDKSKMSDSTNDPAWLKSDLLKACRDDENCGSYGAHGRCRDAFCAQCSSGSCETLAGAQECCLESTDCTAVYGGGAHWWTFHAPCVEEEHANYYNVWHRGVTPTPSPPTPSPPPPNPDFPAGLLTCNAGTPPLRTSCTDPGTLSALNHDIRAAVKVHFETLAETCNNDECPRGDLAGCLIRLVGHDIMDYNPLVNNGGADGCIDFEDHDNKGLKGCMLTAVNERDSSDVSLELMWQSFCTEVSIADFFVIAAEALIEETVPYAKRSTWGQSLENGFRFGRQTALTCSPEPLPNPVDACDAVEDVYMKRLGLDAQGAVALMGVHTLGRALPENSGFDGFWVSHEHAKSMNTKYFENILAVGWMPATTSAGKSQWVRADVSSDHDLASEMMLNSDMCLGYQAGETAPLTRAGEANLSGACLWLDSTHSSMDGVSCGCQAVDLSVGCTEENCCARATTHAHGSNPFGGVRSDAWSHFSETISAVSKYAKSATGMDSWHDDFIGVWRAVTTQGHDLC